MDLKLGERIILKNDYIAQFTREEHDSKSFQIVAVTDVAIAVKNMRSNRTYTLSTATLQKNIEPFIPMKKEKCVQPILDVDIDTEPTLPVVDGIFTHIAPVPVGGFKIVPSIAIGTVTTGEDPFGGLYG